MNRPLITVLLLCICQATVVCQSSQRGYIPGGTDTLQLSVDWQFQEGTIFLAPLSNMTSKKAWLNNAQLFFNDGLLVLSFDMNKADNRTFFVITPFLTIDQKGFLPAPHFLLGDCANVGQNKSAQQKRIYWKGMAGEFRSEQGRIQVEVFVESIKQAPDYFPAGMKPNFAFRQLTPHLLGLGAGLYGIFAGREKQSNARNIYDTEYKSKLLGKDVDTFLQQARDKNDEGKAFVIGGGVILAIDAIWLGIRYANFTKNKNLYDLYYQPNQILAPVYGSTPLGRYYGLKLDITF